MAARRTIRCPRCGALAIIDLDIRDGLATCGSCGLEWPYIPSEAAG